MCTGVMRFTSLTITASDLERAAAFYEGVLGLDVRRTPGGFEAIVGRTTLVVLQGATAWGGIHLAFTIPRNRFDEGKTWLAARTPLSVMDGSDELHLPDAPWCSRSVYFRGPDGIVLELIARDNLHNDSTEPFASASLLCVSEIGMAVQDVRETVARLHAEFGAPPFGSGGDEFAPIGDDDGLFIVVAEGREWFSAPGSRARGVPTSIR